ncbi:MAG: zinc ABC transporter solute-binding protein [Clostridiales bacterium]|nr:zinc ABC transporter solute-binding protein [Clostridiales bacterium]
MKKRLFSIILCMILIFSFGCNKKAEKDKEKIKIVTSFYPMYIFTINLTDGIDGIEVQNLTQQIDGCIHNYQLLPNDMVTLNNATLLVTNGAGMEPFLDKVSKQIPNLPIVDASKGVKLLGSNNHHDSDEHSHDDKHEHEYNSHIWLSVPNAIVQVENIATALKTALPNDSEKIENNKQEYIKRLNALDSQIKGELENYKGTPIITFHEAYDYFASEYGLLIIGSLETDHGEEPSAKQIASFTKTINEFKIPALFVEPEYKGTSANILASETGIKVYTLNPITSGQNSLTAYEDIMKSNLSVIKEALE